MSTEMNGQTAHDLAVACTDLLGRVMAELIERRNSAEAESVRARRALDMTKEDGWQCRAAGLSEAIQVVKRFWETSSPNEKGQARREKI